MKRARKRAPGGGRKPIGATAAKSLLTIRMSDRLRAELEKWAAKRGRSLTQELIWRLERTLRADRRPRRDRISGALGALVTEIATWCFIPRQGASRDWHRDPFLFLMFKHAVARVLGGLQPPGEPRSPVADKLSDNPTNPAFEWLRTPESAGTHIATFILDDLFRPKIVTAGDRAEIQIDYPDQPERREFLVDYYERRFNLMDQVGRALKIKQSFVSGIGHRRGKSD